MKPPHRLAAVAVAILGVLAAGGAPAASGADDCSTTHAAVFYSTDTQRLATLLRSLNEPCTDYYLSITPTADGSPRVGPISVIHNAGPRFHALAEVPLAAPKWQAYADANGWYAAGLEVRRLMTAAGYTANDSWALNEVGAPSNTTKGVEVLRDVGTARADVREFVRGLADGGMRGVVFAAEPQQVTDDLAQYKQELASWYSDSDFWADMTTHVRFWAQETYADARLWGLPASTLAQRNAYLNDYFQHGARLAAAGGRATKVAREFFADAYVPLANASFRRQPNLTNGIGFGFTELPIATMRNFISAQAYAMRAGGVHGRIGYAYSPRPNSSTAAELDAVAAAVAVAIRDSASDAAGSCSSAGVACDDTVTGATSFNDAWIAFANTLEGAQVRVEVDSDVSLTFASVAARGATWASVADFTGAPPAGVQVLGRGAVFDLATTAAYAGPVTACLDYDATTYAGYAPRVFALSGGAWTDVTSAVESSSVCGSAPSLGTFAVFARDASPPAIVPSVAGQLGSSGWYTSDVTVTWNVTDPQSPVASASGCAATTLTTDTVGTTLTCTATSDGGTHSVSVTVKRDATAPDMTCAPTPEQLWPPNRQLVPVTVAVAVVDATSGARGFTLSRLETSEGDIAADSVGFVRGTPAIAGLLRAERSGAGGHRTYVLTYTGRDVAGNAAECVATVVVSHDQRA